MNPVEVETIQDVGSDEVYIKVTLNDGTVLTKHVEHALGTKENPMTDKQPVAKFEGLVGGILPSNKIARLLNHLEHLAELPDVSVIAVEGSL